MKKFKNQSGTLAFLNIKEKLERRIITKEEFTENASWIKGQSEPLLDSLDVYKLGNGYEAIAYLNQKPAADNVGITNGPHVEFTINGEKWYGKYDPEYTNYSEFTKEELGAFDFKIINA